MAVSTVNLLTNIESLIAATEYASRFILTNRGPIFGRGGISIEQYNGLISRKAPLERILNSYLSDTFADSKNALATARTISLRISSVRRLIVSANAQLKINTTSASQAAILKADIDSNSKVLQLLMSLESWASTQQPKK